MASTTRDSAEILGERRALADRGDVASESYLAGMTALDEQRLMDALAAFEAAGSAGDADAMFEAGAVAERVGLRDAADYWFETASITGNADAAYALGVQEAGRGDVDAAGRWFERATELGLAAGYGALTVLADRSGDEQAERRWSLAGARVGVPHCMARHAYFLLLDSQEEGVDRRPILEEALHYADRASAEGEAYGSFCGALICRAFGSDTGARRFMTLAAEQGHPDALSTLREWGL